MGLGRHLSSTWDLSRVGVPRVRGEGVSGRGVSMTKQVMPEKDKGQRTAGWCSHSCRLCVHVCERQKENVLWELRLERKIGATLGGLLLPPKGLGCQP